LYTAGSRPVVIVAEEQKAGNGERIVIIEQAPPEA
jgi:hypothetical protein